MEIVAKNLIRKKVGDLIIMYVTASELDCTLEALPASIRLVGIKDTVWFRYHHRRDKNYMVFEPPSHTNIKAQLWISP